MKIQHYTYRKGGKATLVLRQVTSMKEVLEGALITTMYFDKGELVHARCATAMKRIYDELALCETCIERIPIPHIVLDRIPLKEKWIENQRVCQPAHQSETSTRQADEEDT